MEGDTVEANCTSHPSNPVTNITWYMNDKQVSGRKVRQQFRDAFRVLHDTTRQDTTRHNTRQGKTRHEKTRQDTRYDKTRQDNTRHEKTRQDTTRLDNTRHFKTRHDKTRHDSQNSRDVRRPTLPVVSTADSNTRPRPYEAMARPFQG
jgi:hypothetical protein